MDKNMSNEKRIIITIERLAKELNEMCETYIVGKGIRRFLSNKRDLKLCHFEIITKDLEKLENVVEYSKELNKHYITTSIGDITVRQQELKDYFNSKCTDINKIAIGKEGFVFEKSCKNQAKRSIRNREFKLLDTKKSFFEEYLWLRYEGYECINFMRAKEYILEKEMTKKELMNGIHLGLKLNSRNISYSLYNLGVFDQLSYISIGGCKERDLLLKMTRDDMYEYGLGTEEKLNSKLIAFIYMLIPKRKYNDKELDMLFLDYGVKVDKSLYDDIKVLFDNGIGAFGTPSCDQMNYIKDLLLYTL